MTKKYTTAKEYVDARIAQQNLPYKERYANNNDDHLIDVLRYLPRDEASKLLTIYTFVCDGDYGYGSWHEGYTCATSKYFNEDADKLT